MESVNCSGFGQSNLVGPKLGRIQSEMNMLEEQISRVESRVADLYQNLTPILGMPNLSEGKDEAKSSGSAMANALHTFSTRLSSIVDQLDDIIQRQEL